MSIIGIGVDIVNNNRFKKLVKKKNFLKEYLPKNETKFIIKLKNKAKLLLKRFAAKEAFSKATGLVFPKIYILKILK